jgi:hypothetical protein
MLYLTRFHWSDDERDLETSILHSTHAIFLPFHIVTGTDRNIISTLFSLSKALFYRSIKYEQPNDVMHCIKCFHFLRDPSLEAFGIKRNAITALLIQAMAFRMKLEPAGVDAMQNVEEMSVLCQELLSQASDLPKQDLKDAMDSFSYVVLINLFPLGNQISQQVTERLRQASMCLHDPHFVSFVLFISFASRFHATQSIDAYGNAMTTLDEILSQQFPSDHPSPYVGQAVSVAATLLKTRYIFHQNPRYLEEAISRYRGYLGFTSLEDPYRSEIIHSLEELKQIRLEEFGITNGLQEAHSSDAEVVNLPSFSGLASLTELDSVKSHSMTMEDRHQHLNTLLAMNNIADRADVKEAVKYCRVLLTSLQPHSDDSMTVTLLTVCLLGNFFLHAFELTQNPEYLDESIDVFQGILEVPRPQLLHFWVSRKLIQALWSRFGLSNDLGDFDEIMRFFPIAVTNTYGKERDRFKISCQWALFSRVFEHSSTSTAYKSAISLLQDSLVFSPTLEMQYLRLVSMRDHVEKLPLDYASYQVHIGQLKEAIETLEQGRGLLWSELRGMRTSIDRLRRVDPRLAENFASINQDLEALTTSESQVFWPNNGDVNSREEMDPFSHTVVKQRRLLDDRTNLIIQIRSLPGFETFLTSPSFDTLFSAAAHGPVIIINHCEWRSDIIILLYGSPPSYIPTPDDFYDRARSLKDQLSAARKESLESKEYEDALTCVLATLYDLVGRPVIQRLNELNVPEQSRIWWCPTSVFVLFLYTPWDPYDRKAL